MRIALVGALLALPAAAQVPSQCNQPPRPVSLETGIRIDLVYCDKPPITRTVEYQKPNSQGQFYTIITHNLSRPEDGSPAHVLIYKPNANWAVPATSLDSMGAKALTEGAADDGDHTGWVAQKDFRFNQAGHDWLSAREIVLQKAAINQWVYYRIIRDTRHNLLYVLYQRDSRGGGATEEDPFFDSFAVDTSVTVDPEKTPGAHLPPPYPNL